MNRAVRGNVTPINWSLKAAKVGGGLALNGVLIGMAKQIYRVRELNESNKNAVEYEAYDVQEAATDYAEEDVDAHHYGTYVQGHKLIVVDPKGVEHTVKVFVDYDPTFTAYIETPDDSSLNSQG